MLSRAKEHWANTPRRARRIVVGVIGGTVLLFGMLLIVLPGPAFIVIPAGLAILATEFAWARLWLKKVRRMFRREQEAKASREQEVRKPPAR